MKQLQYTSVLGLLASRQQQQDVSLAPHCAVRWPAPDGLAFAQALELHGDLTLEAGTVVHLTERLILKGNRMYRVTGAPDGDCTLFSSAHSLIQLAGRHARLELQNLKLQHTCNNPDKREVGSALFLLGRTQARLSNCEISSTKGFGLWMVQSSSCHLQNCTVRSCGRTGLACLGIGTLDIVDSTIEDCAVHGICARGTTTVSAERTAFINNAVRAIYAYGNTVVTISECTVSGTRAEGYMGTKCRAAAAIEIESKRIDDTVTVQLKGLTATDNLGADVRLSGQVKYLLQGCSECRVEIVEHEGLVPEALPSIDDGPRPERAASF